MSIESRTKLFIGHATPEDNEFTIWLASRLQLLGYEVWIDKTGLIGGEKFWDEIDSLIRNQSIKYLLVYSKNICQKDEEGNIIRGKLKDGISKEYSLAESIAKQEKLNDFIILLNIDGEEFNLFIDAPRLNHVPFSGNWSTGLEQLHKKLTKDNVPCSDVNSDDGFATWYTDHFLSEHKVQEKYELYYSNIWPINKLPDYFYIHQFSNKSQADKVQKQFNGFPISQMSNCISTFIETTDFQIIDNDIELQVSAQKIYKIKITDVFMGNLADSFPTNRDAENHLKRLLSKIFHLLMRNRGMYWYQMANKRLAYYYTPRNLPTLKVKFEYPYREIYKFKTKNLIGKHKTLGKWHFAISCKPILSPVLGFSLKSHICFTDDGFSIWKDSKGEIDKSKIHSQRRAKGKRMFNEEWRDEFLAFLSGLQKEGTIEIALNKDFKLSMPFSPESYWADFGYYDPKDKTRQELAVVDHFESDDELNEDYA